MNERKKARAARVARAAVAMAAIAVTGPAVPAAGAPHAAASGAGASIQIFARSPVLVRSGERIRIPVDVVCLSGGRACRAEVTMSVRDPDGSWRSRSAGTTDEVRFDLSGPASRAAPGGRMVFRISARDARGHRARLPVRTDIAVAGRATLAASQDRSQSVVVRRLDPNGATLDERSLGAGILSSVRASGSRGFVRTLPLDEWVPVGGGLPSTGRPLPGGDAFLQAVVGNSVRLGIATGGRVRGAVELRSSERLGELALAEPNGRGGYVVVVHVAGPSTATDRYEVIRVRRDLTVAAFAVPNESTAETMPLSRFRLGRDGNLYRIATSPDGVRIVRYRMGGSR